MSHPMINELTRELRLDEQRLEAGSAVSDTAVRVPTVNSGVDKRTGLGRELARALFPASDEERVDSYIAYGRLVSKLRGAYKTQLAEMAPIDKGDDPFREARMYGKREVFESLMAAPISDRVLYPTPMPVETAPYDELSPFFTHMKRGVEAEEPCMEFTRGAYYDDGRIDMCKQVVGPEYIGDLVQSVRLNPHVEHFLLGNNVVGDDGAFEIASLMRQPGLPAIRTYYLAGNCFTEQGAADIAQALTENDVAESLWLKRNPLGTAGVAHIARMLESNTSLRTLDLVNTGMLDAGVEVLFNSLRMNQSLRTLYIDANGITAEGARHMAAYFDFLKREQRIGLTGLFLSINRLGDAGVKELAEALEGYPHLVRLDLSSNRFQTPGLSALLQTCAGITELAHLGIGIYKSTSDLGELPNYFDGEGAEMIAAFIRKNTPLKTMEMKDVNLREGGLEIVAEALEENTNLLDLVYYQFRYAPPQELTNRIVSRLERTTRAIYGMTLEEFRKGPKREIKHSDQIGFIDSIYRNNMKSCHICT